MWQACIHNLEEALVSCKRIGYPIMLKASWGGGGKGIRKVHTPRTDTFARASLYCSCQTSLPGTRLPAFAPSNPSRCLSGSDGTSMYLTAHKAALSQRRSGQDHVCVLLCACHPVEGGCGSPSDLRDLGQREALLDVRKCQCHAPLATAIQWCSHQKQSIVGSEYTDHDQAIPSQDRTGHYKQTASLARVDSCVWRSAVGQK